MSFMKENIVDIELTSGNIHRSFLNHSIGRNDDDADWFGVRVFRNGEPVNLEGSSVQGFFKQPGRDPIAITSGNYISGNVAEVLLPQACYNYEGQFTLAIKLVSTSEGVTGTMRIVDGMVDNTNVNGAVAPTGAIPTYQEILAVYEQMVAAKEGSVRFDITQELTSAQRLRARNNILGASQADMDAVQAKIGNTPMPTTAQTLTGAIDEHDADIGAIETKIGNTTLPTTAQTLTGAIAEEVTEREAAVSAEASAREAADATKVPNTRKVNGHALSADVTVTKGDVGLGNVDNTSDADKPISTAQAEVNTQVSGIIGDTTLPTTAQTLTGAIAEEVAEREAAVAAEASAREAGDAELKSAINSMTNPIVLTNWESGSFNVSTGADVASTAYIRNQLLFGVSTGIVNVNCDDGYLFLPRAWNASGTYLGTLQTDNTFSKTGTNYQMCSSFYCGAFPDYKFKIAMRMNPSSTSITTSDGSHCRFCYATDKTLTRENEAADAKACGDLKSTIKLDEEVIENVSNASFGVKWLTFKSGAYRTASSPSIGDSVYYETNASYITAICDCVKNEVFCAKITGSSGSRRAYFFCDANMKAVNFATVNLEVNGKITVPNDDNIAYVVFNNLLTSLESGYYAYKGNAIQETISEMYDKIDACRITKGESEIVGITISPINDYQAYLYGSNTSGSVKFIDFTNGAWGVVASSESFLKKVPAGKYEFTYEFAGETSVSDVYFSKVNTIVSGGSERIYNGQVIDSQNPFSIMMRVPSSQSFGTSESPTLLTIHLKGENIKDIYTVIPTNDTTDRTTEIRTKLCAYKECKLTAGDFYVSGINMPDNTVIEGSGKETRIILLDSVTTGFAIKMGSKCIVKNCSVVGSFDTLTFTDGVISEIRIGTRHGIGWIGEATGGTSTSSNNKHFEGIITQCYISGFSGGGITCESTGYGTDAGVTVTDCHISNCGAGINVSWWSEFNRFTSVNCNKCYYGCINNGGNNSFVNCGFSSNNTGFYINELDNKAVRYDGTVTTARNGSHGQAVGCVINHSGLADYAGSNNGYAIYDVNGESGFTYDSMQLFYGKVCTRYSSHVILSNSQLSNIELQVYGNTGTFIGNMCYLRTSVTATVTDSTSGDPWESYDSEGNTPRAKLINCYNFKGELKTLQSIAN